MSPKTIPVPESTWRSLEAMRADFLANEAVSDRWDSGPAAAETREWAQAVKASGVLRAALEAVAAEDPELADQ